MGKKGRRAREQRESRPEKTQPEKTPAPRYNFFQAGVAVALGIIVVTIFMGEYQILPFQVAGLVIGLGVAWLLMNRKK